MSSICAKDINNPSQAQEILSMDILVKTPLNNEFRITVSNNEILLEKNISILKDLIASHTNNQEFYLESMDRSDFTQDDIIQLYYPHKIIAKSILNNKGIDIHPKSLLTHDSEIVKLLLIHNVNIHANNDQALRCASGHGHLEVVKLLLDNGADVHADNDQALRCASHHGHLEVVKLLLIYNANVHANNNEALIQASKKNHSEIVKLLLVHGADIHANDNQALKEASYSGHLEVVKVLLKYKANVHANDNEALTQASKKKHAEVVKLLLSHGAKISTLKMILP